MTENDKQKNINKLLGIIDGMQTETKESESGESGSDDCEIDWDSESSVTPVRKAEPNLEEQIIMHFLPEFHKYLQSECQTYGGGFLYFENFSDHEIDVTPGLPQNSFVIGLINYGIFRLETQPDCQTGVSQIEFFGNLPNGKTVYLRSTMVKDFSGKYGRQRNIRFEDIPFR